MKNKFVWTFWLMVIFLAGAVSAATCALDVQLTNQDPYPAIPGEYVKVIFQIDGVNNPECGNVVFELLEEFPFSLDPGVNSTITAKSGSIQNFDNYWLVPFRLRIDENALEGDNEIEVSYYTGREELRGSSQIKKFNINLDNTRTDFEVSVKDYIASTNVLTFEILNTGEHDAEALTIEIPKQGGIVVKGSNRNIVGSLDSNEDTTFDFEAVPEDGKIKLNIIYTDEINERRALEKEVVFDSSYFTGRVRDIKTTPKSYYIVGAIVLIVVIWWIARKVNKRRREKHHHEHHG